MKIDIQYKITEKHSQKVLSTINRGYDVDDNIICEDLKKIIVDSIPMMSIFNVESQTIKWNQKEVVNSEVITNKSGYKFDIVVTDKETYGSGMMPKNSSKKP